jgi:CO/xanthine dehydrogenase Mo-binding subunit
MASGFILRSPHAHARIKSIDTSAAEAMEGVLSVVTADDLPDVTDKIADLGEGSVNLSYLSNNVLARDKALYRGHAVAAVAATNVHIAEEAANAIKVEYEPLPSVTWVMDAMKEDAPLLHDDVFTKSGNEQSEQASNVALHLNFQQGDVQKGFEEADVVVEREFKMATVHQGYIEPHAVLVDWNQDGRIKVWASTQGSFTCRQQTAEVLQVPLSHVTVVPCEIGGGFGGKIAVYLEPVAAILSRKAGRPVQIVMRRNDVFEATGPTPGAFIRVKLGATKDGKLTAGEAWLAYESGAYPGGMLGPGCMCVFSCYEIPNAIVDGYEVCLNKPHIKAYRAPGATQAAFACESVIDELAGKLGISILELQQKNAAKEGTRRVDGPVYPRVGLVECLEAAAGSDHWNTPLEGKNRGRGMASGFWFGCGLKSSVVASVNSDGTVNLTEGSTDIGGTRTSIAMQIAEVLGLESDDINPRVVDTDNIGYTDVTGGSRTTFATGMAAYEAGLDLQRQMTDRAAELWECNAEDIKITDGIFSVNGHQANFKELATELFQAGEPLVGRATVAPECSTNGFGTHLVDVEVDTDTGKVTILRYTAIQDAGKAVHPSYVEGQLQGGAVQGIGWALNEEYFFDDEGEMKNASFLDYRMPTAFDLPMIDTIIVEAANPDHPYGVRGVGETPIIPPPAAIANAIHDAIGVRMQELPMSPPRLWKAIQTNQDSD